MKKKLILVVLAACLVAVVIFTALVILGTIKNSQSHNYPTKTDNKTDKGNQL